MRNTTERSLDMAAAHAGTSSTSEAPGAPGPATPPTPLLLPHEDAEPSTGLYPVTYIGEFETAGEWPFPQDRTRVVVGGSRSCDNASSPALSIPGRGLSGIHVLLERRANSIRIYDKGSTNGTYVGNTKIETSWDVRIGDKFSPRPLTLFLMDSVMHAHRGMLAEILGTGSRPSPDMLLTEVVRQACHVIITGEEGCGQERLAKAIHDMSPRRAHAMLPIADIPADRAAQSALVRQASKPKTTVVLQVGPRRDNPPLEPTFISSLYSPSYGVRVIVLADTEEDAEHALPKQHFRQSYHVGLRPVAYRSGEIDQLLDRMFAARDAEHLRTADLLVENQEALRMYSWPKNLAQLHTVADAIVAHEAHGGLRAAGRALGLAPATMHGHLARVGLKARKLGDRERPSLFQV
jgi:FHA domain/Sigma-54 interaction domain